MLIAIVFYCLVIKEVKDKKKTVTKDTSKINQNKLPIKTLQRACKGNPSALTEVEHMTFRLLVLPLSYFHIPHGRLYSNQFRFRRLLESIVSICEKSDVSKLVIKKNHFFLFVTKARSETEKIRVLFSSPKSGWSNGDSSLSPPPLPLHSPHLYVSYSQQ